MNERILKALTEQGLVTMQYLERAKHWEDSFEFITYSSTPERNTPNHDGSLAGKVWIKELKGLLFDTMEDAKEYAYVNWCGRNTIHSAVL